MIKSACNNLDRVREVAQPGSALASGARGRRFESALPDHFKIYELVSHGFQNSLCGLDTSDIVLYYVRAEGRQAKLGQFALPGQTVIKRVATEIFATLS